MRTQVELFYNLNKNYKQILTDNWAKHFIETYELVKKKFTITKTPFFELNNKNFDKIKKGWIERHYYSRKIQFSKD